MKAQTEISSKDAKLDLELEGSTERGDPPSTAAAGREGSAKPEGRTGPAREHSPRSQDPAPIASGDPFLQQYLEQLAKSAPLVATDLREQLRQSTERVVLLDPRIIGLSRWANRHADSYKTEEFSQLRAAIEHEGANTQPVYVRPCADAESGRQFEVVSGSRRVRACQELGLSVRAIVLPHLPDSQLFTLMFQENNARSDPRPYELGRMCHLALEQGLYSSSRKMAEALDQELATLTRAVRVFRLPQEVHQAIASPLEWQVKDADLIEKLLDQDREAVVKLVNELQEACERLPRAQLIQRLQRAVGVGSTNTDGRTPIVIGGEAAGYIQTDAKGKLTMTVQHPMLKGRMTEVHEAVQSVMAKLLPGAASGRKAGAPKARP
jgi:ParB family transcriptional regulator, chromosome partitioning protein